MRALGSWEKALGPDHSEVAESLNDLGLMYREQGRRDGAEPLPARALSIRERTLGSDHPLTKVTREALDTLRKDSRPHRTTA
jgi:hypothetical protein